METKIATSVTQSNKLIELGLSADTADMWRVKHYLIAKNQELDKPSDDEINDVFPAWSLSALIELMPMYLLNDDDEEFGLAIVTTYKNEYEVCYQELLPPIYNSSLIDAAFEMICYLLENKLIK